MSGNQWIKAVRCENWKPTKYSRLSSKHFEKSIFINGLSINELKTDAVPVIFEGYPNYCQLSVAKKRKQKNENQELTPRKRKRIEASGVKTKDLPTTPRRAMKKKENETSSRFKLHEDTDYDFAAHRMNPKKTNVKQSVANLVKAVLGGGIMGVHEAFMKAGLWASLITAIFFGIYICYCTHLLARSAHMLCRRLHLPAMSYPDVAEASLEFGPFKNLRKYSKCFRHAVDAVIMIELFGACCVYLIIIAKTIKQLVEGNDVVEDINTVRLYIVALWVPIIAIGMITSLKYLAPFSMVANFFILLCVLATVYYGMKKAVPISERPFFKNIFGYFECCGVLAFGMECIGVSLAVENSMRRPDRFPRALKYAFIIVSIFIITTGFFGYWGFGEACVSPVHLNFPNEVFPVILKCMMALMIYVTFAVNFYAPFNLAWYYIQRKYDPTRYSFWERVYRILIITCIFCVAIAFPNIGNLMGLLGSFCISFIDFIFPPYIELLVVWDAPGLGRSHYKIWLNSAIILIGLFLLVLGVYSNGKGLIANLR